MKKIAWLGMLAMLILSPSAFTSGWRKDSIDLLKINNGMKGRVVDYTDNHSGDYRMWSKTLAKKRDLYVYLPPNYCKDYRYPIVLLMHGFAEDEQSFLPVIPHIDEAIAAGRMPPTIIAMPDGSLKGEPSCSEPGSFYLNTASGDFEDYLLQDVWDFVAKRYPIRSEREAHVLAGVSMGGFAAYNLGMRHREAFGVVAGVFPPLNLRWVDDQNRYFAKFDPKHWGWRTSLEESPIVARYYGGLVKLRLNQFVEPLFGTSDTVIEELARNNPIELIDNTHLRNGELAMYVAFGGKDEFNVDAQVESFLYLAKYRGLAVDVGYDPEGHHDLRTGLKLLPGVTDWLGKQLQNYPPVPVQSCESCR